MKTNDYLLLGGTLAYSFLFYQQDLGINVLLFNLVFSFILLCRNPTLFYSRKWVLCSMLGIISSLGVFFHSSELAMLANIFSLLILSGVSINPKTSQLLSLLFACYSVITSFLHAVFDIIRRTENREKPAGQRLNYAVYTVPFVFFLSLTFFALYRQSNPLFAQNTDWISFDFISWDWVVFTFMGLLLVYGGFYHKTIGLIENKENSLAGFNSLPGEEENQPRYEAERFAGMLLFVALNLMLLVLNVGDVQTIWFSGKLPEGVTHSDFVHNGVGVIILSIMIAGALIMFLYRSNFAGVKRSRLLNLLVFAWLLQNLLMLFSTAWRNHIYISDYNLTYKRLGVYVWLCLAVIGLVTMLIKIWGNRSNWYLVKVNFATWHVALALSATVSWDRVITHYNLANKPLDKVDFRYLFSLSDSNLPELVDIYLGKDLEKIKYPLPDYGGMYNMRFLRQDFSTLLAYKLKNHVKTDRHGWQGYNLRDERIDESIEKVLSSKKK